MKILPEEKRKSWKSNPASLGSRRKNPWAPHWPNWTEHRWLSRIKKSASLNPNYFAAFRKKDYKNPVRKEKKILEIFLLHGVQEGKTLEHPIDHIEQSTGDWAEYKNNASLNQNYFAAFIKKRL